MSSTLQGIPSVPVDSAQSVPERLVAVVVGVNVFLDPLIENLKCSVNDAESIANALEQTCQEKHLLLKSLMSPQKAGREEIVLSPSSPTKRNILDAMQWAAGEATSRDTFMFFFAGHGGLYRGRPCIMPMDTRLSDMSAESAAASLLFVEELQDFFHEHNCRGRVMFIDCCQNVPQADDSSASVSDMPALRGLQWRAGGQVSTTLVDAFQQRPDGWSIVLSCSPGECSVEDHYMGEHGVFSHWLSVGLRGKADLDNDKVVSFAELMQFVGNHVPRQAAVVIEEINEGLKEMMEKTGLDLGESLAQTTQTPTVIWSGPVAVPLTRTLKEDREAFQPEVLPLWRQHLRANLPYKFPLQNMLRYGLEVLYAITVMLALGLVLPPFSSGARVGISVAAGLASAGIFHGVFALIGAAAGTRWHTGGHVTWLSLLFWHVALLGMLVGLWSHRPGDVAAAALIDGGVTLFGVACAVIVFAINPIQTCVVLADIAQRGKPTVLRKAFRWLDEKGFNADLPNTIAMLSIGFRAYLFCALIASVGPVAHLVYLLLNHVASARFAFTILRDVFILLLILWAVPWYGSCYHAIRAQVLPDE